MWKYNRFKVGDLVAYKKDFIHSRPVPLGDGFVYKIQDTDENGNYYLLPKDNYLKIYGKCHDQSTWACSDVSLDSFSDRPDLFWGEAEEKMYGAEPSLSFPSPTYCPRYSTGLSWNDSSLNQYAVIPSKQASTDIKVEYECNYGSSPICKTFGYSPKRRSSLQEDIRSHG